MAIHIEKPYKLFELIQKAEEGDPEAMYDVVTAITIDSLDEDDPEGEIQARRVRYLKQLVQIPGYENSFILLGDAYARGEGVEQNADEAFKWYEKAVQAGESFGNECIGQMYYFGYGVPVDYEKAYGFFMKNEDHRSFSTIYLLGEMFRQGLFVNKEPERAFHYYQIIINDNSKYKEHDDYYWRACFRSAFALHNGIGTQKDIPKAAALIDIAKFLFDKRGTETNSDITKTEVFDEWIAIRREAEVLL